MVTYQQEKQNVLQLFQVAILFAQQTNQKHYVQTLQEVRRHLDEKRFTVTACGEFRSGKSSLLNALLDEYVPLLPSEIGVSTSSVSAIRYGPVEKITVQGSESSLDNSKEVTIPPSDIHKYVTEQENPHNTRGVRSVVIEIPKEQLKSGLVLVDTPGIGGLNTQQTRFTYDLILGTDVLLFVSDALRPLSSSDLEFIKLVVSYCEHIIFVLTKIDLFGDYQQTQEYHTQRNLL